VKLLQIINAVITLSKVSDFGCKCTLLLVSGALEQISSLISEAEVLIVRGRNIATAVKVLGARHHQFAIKIRLSEEVASKQEVTILRSIFFS
jgi:DNA-binding protein